MLTVGTKTEVAMRIADTIEAFINGNGWDDEIERNEETGRSRVSTNFIISNQLFELCVEGDENGELLVLFLSAPFRVIEGKYVDACMYFNYINDCFNFSGRISVSENGWISYREPLMTDGIELDGRMIDNMLASGIMLFERHFDAIASIAMTRKTYEAIREEYFKKNDPGTALPEGTDCGIENEA